MPPLIAALVGFYLGQIALQFPAGASGRVVSDGTGPARTEFRRTSDGVSRLTSYEGVLPGFVENGSTVATVELETGTVEGVVTTPEGEQLSLQDVLPGLRAEPQPDNSSLRLLFNDGPVAYEYKMHIEADATSDGENLHGAVQALRQTTRNGEVLLDDRSEGTMEGTREDIGSGDRPAPLQPLPPPIIIDAGPSKTISAGQSAVLEATVRGGEETTWSWEPAQGLDDPSDLTPTATPQSTTTYSLLVTDKHGQRAIDRVTITVAELLVASAGEDFEISSGEAISLNAVVTGGVGPYTYLWEPADLTLISDPTVPNPAGFPQETTTYTVTVTDSLGQTASASITVTVIDSDATEEPQPAPEDECSTASDCDDFLSCTDDSCAGSPKSCSNVDNCPDDMYCDRETDSCSQCSYTYNGTCCERYLSCASCWRGSVSCGWCEDIDRCVAGDEQGPDSGSCDTWVYYDPDGDLCR